MFRILSLAAIYVLACVVLIWPAAAHARSILDLDVQTQPEELLDWGDFVLDTTGEATLKDILRRPQAFQPTHENSAYALQPGQALWIRFAVPATPDDQRWYVRIAQPGLDSVVLYTRGADDSWSRQQSGDALPVSKWPLPHLYPVLPLAISAEAPTNYMLRIEASDGVEAPIEFVSESALSSDQQRLSLLYGIYFGLLAMGAIFALFSSAALRDATYFWFGMWTVLAILAAATAAGVTQLHLWPEMPRWGDAAHYVLPAAAGVPFILFVVQVFAVRERDARLFWPCIAVALFVGVLAASTAALPSPQRLWLGRAAMAIGVVLAIALCTWAWARDPALAKRVVGALSPFGIALAVHSMRRLVGHWAEENALAILLAGLAITICATYLLLGSRHVSSRDAHQRIARLREIDPLTGLVNETVFGTRLAELIERARRFEHHSVVAIIDFPNFPALRAEFGRNHSLALLLRIAERLGAMTRTVDTVARLGEWRFGLQVDGPIAPSRARALCAKVIAHCITPMSGLPMGMVAKPRIALALVPAHGDVPQEILMRLDEMLREASDDPTRVILIANTTATHTARRTPAASCADDGLTDFLPTSASDEVV
ncbi:MAG TPA: 7TM-DISM domain-containing protein [Ramlibacter sp.]|uniref:sensor domain-containing diguanylate cyclase n=1 Tax=Ramlibacter sp. TaxID=1917967 RepID=UPI002BC7F0D2|nr:7TM-DISM domain-containing protein [Ramlibacter sp.]HVZ45071.1 7TM-DISM domain-containing protein [Ramlibacter sp.]